MLKKSFVILFSFLFLISFCLVGSVFAAAPDMPEDMPNLMWSAITDFDYVVYTGDDSLTYMVLFVVSGERNLDDARLYTSDTGKIAFTTEERFARYNFQLDAENSKWVQLGDATSFSNGGTTSFGNENMSSSQLHYCTLDIYFAKETDSIFFPATPIGTIMTLDQVIAQETPLMGAKIIQAMMTILLCGVGCLALLIGLPILLKVLCRFL